MNRQLTLYEQIERENNGKKAKKRYIRDTHGRFATRQQHQLDEAKTKAERYRLLYEVEKRKNDPITKRLVEAERRLKEITDKIKNL